MRPMRQTGGRIVRAIEDGATRNAEACASGARPRTRAAALALLAASGLGLAGCGSSGGDDPVGDPSVDPVVDAPEDDTVGTVPSGAPDAGPDGEPDEGPGDAPDGAPGDGVPPSDAAVAFRPDQISIEDASGSIEIVIDSYDDALGAIVVQERFVNRMPSEERRYAYDDAGRLETRVDSRGESGEAFRAVVYSYAEEEYADGGLAVAESADAQGTLERRTTYEFGSDGLVESSNLVALADDQGEPIPGGLLIERIDYAYADGRLASESIDENGDGAPERTRDYAYLPDGRLDTVTTNDAAEGATSVETWRYETGPCSLAWANSLFAHFCVPLPDGG